MLRESLQLLQRYFLLLDAVWIALSWIIAYWVRFQTGWIPIYFGVPSLETYLAHLPLVLVVWVAALTYGGTYRTERWWNSARERKALFRSSVVAMVLLVSIVYLSTKVELSRVFYACFYCLTLVGLLAIRRIFRSLFHRSREDRSGLRRVLIVGKNAFVAPFCEKVEGHPETGLTIHGQLLPEDAQGGASELVVLGGYPAIREVVRAERIDIVVFALPLEYGSVSKELLRRIEDLAVDIQVIPDVFPIMPLHPGVEDFEGIPFIQVRASPQQGMARLEKRVLDVVLSGLAMIVMAPAFLIIALLIKVTSPGPVFYRQPRLGMDGKEFLLFMSVQFPMVMEMIQVARRSQVLFNILKIGFMLGWLVAGGPQPVFRNAALRSQAAIGFA